MSLKSRRKLLLHIKNGENDDFDWSNRIGYFNTSYTTDNGWWNNGNYNKRIITAMENLNSSSYTKRKYFFMWNISNTWRVYVSDSPFYVTYNDAPVSKYVLLHNSAATERYLNGTSEGINHQYYGTKDNIVYSRDHSARSQAIIETLITNFPIFDWGDEIPSNIPMEGGAIRLY